MKELSVFIDESGDFGEVKENPAYYLVTLVFHDQRCNIENQVKNLEDSTRNSGFDFEYIQDLLYEEREYLPRYQSMIDES